MKDWASSSARGVLAPVAACAALACVALPVRAADGDADASVRLMLMISIDQLTPAELDVLRPYLSGGLARFLESGQDFRAAALDYGVTETAAGHSTLGTGTSPRAHGVVANEWWSRALERGQYCFEDDAARGVRAGGFALEGGGADLARSPRNLRRPALGEWLRRADAQSKSVSIAGKDRAAIGMLGRGDLALWWDLERGGFASSTAYVEALPDWVRDWNDGWIDGLCAGPFGAGWTDAYAARLEGDDAAPDDRPGEARAGFPYACPGFADRARPTAREVARLSEFAFSSPACDASVIDLARRALAALELGADEHVDFLALGLSAHDVVGHACGPGSRETTDLLLRADEALGRLLEDLDTRVGAGRWVAVLSADHGVLPLPESLAQAEGPQRRPARRIGGRDVGKVLRAGREALLQRYGDALGFGGDARGVHVSAARLRELSLDASDVRSTLAQALLAAGADWLACAFTLEQLAAGPDAEHPAAGDDLLAFESRSFDAERSPDVSLVPAAYALVAMPKGTSHGSPHEYDRRVPLLFLGARTLPGARSESARLEDALPTLFARAGLAVPEGLDGRVLPVGAAR